MTTAVGTPQIDGLRIGAETRARAAAAGVPVTYWIRTQELGWSWAAVPRGTPHIVPPEGDLSECGRIVRRGERIPISTGIAASACDNCWRRVLGDTPRRTR